MKKEIEFFDKLWSERTVDLDAAQVHWDSRAEEFNSYKEIYRVKEIFDLLVLKGVLDNKTEVLDIGCGTGNYTFEFAKKAKFVTGIDISPKMVEFARKNAVESEITNTEFRVLPWEKIDIGALSWEKRFGLVCAIMTPAISSKKCLDNMIEASKGYCIMSGHVDRREQVKEDIEKKVLGYEPPKIDFGRNVYYSLNILWNYGVYPELTYYDMEVEKVRSIDKAYNYYCSQISLKYNLSQEQKLQIKEYLNQISKNGQVSDVFQSKTAWLVWKNL